MQKSALVGVRMALAAAVAAGASVWSLLLAPRTVQLHISGLPEWGSTTVRFGRHEAKTVAPGVYEGTVRTGEHQLQVGGGLGEPCERCCFELSQPVPVAFSSETIPLSATVPECPTADYDTAMVAPGPVSIDGVAAESRRAVIVSGSIAAALWDGEGGCGEAVVGCVTWLEVIRFANRLSTTEGLTPAYYDDAAHRFPYSHRGGSVCWSRAARGCRLRRSGCGRTGRRRPGSGPGMPSRIRTQGARSCKVKTASALRAAPAERHALRRPQTSSFGWSAMPHRQRLRKRRRWLDPLGRDDDLAAACLYDRTHRARRARR